MWMLNPHVEHCQKTNPYGKAEGKAPTKRLWNVEDSQKLETSEGPA